MIQNLVKNLRAEWKKPENKPPEMEAAANAIEYLYQLVKTYEGNNDIAFILGWDDYDIWKVQRSFEHFVELEYTLKCSGCLVSAVEARGMVAKAEELRW